MCRICLTQYDECVQERKHTPPSATSMLQSHSEGVSPKQSASHTRETWQGIHCRVHFRSTRGFPYGTPSSLTCARFDAEAPISLIFSLSSSSSWCFILALWGGTTQHSTDTGIWRRKRNGIGLVKLGPSQSWYTSFISVAKYPP